MTVKCANPKCNATWEPVGWNNKKYCSVKCYRTTGSFRAFGVVVFNTNEPRREIPKNVAGVPRRNDRQGKEEIR